MFSEDDALSITLLFSELAPFAPSSAIISFNPFIALSYVISSWIERCFHKEFHNVVFSSSVFQISSKPQLSKNESKSALDVNEGVLEKNSLIFY